MQETGERCAGFNRSVTMQIKRALHDPVSAPQFAQHVRRQAFAQKFELFAGFEACFPWVVDGQALGQRLFVVTQALPGDRRW